ncbi:hypothetical protein LJB99_00770 [Deltaproteobacteria bacterium OttesenSCG-928-K17]|nr:hypothetical protein [Deltaproteobacteria bacterium OttesenSCG-928-K17]
MAENKVGRPLPLRGLIAAALLALMLWAGPAAAEDSPGGYIVFTAGDDDARSIMVAGGGGGLPRVLVGSSFMDTQPAIGPQGQVAWIRRFSLSEWALMENGRVVSKGPMHLSPTYRPDGTLVAAVSGKTETNIYAFETSGRKLLVRGGQDGFAVSPSFSPDGRWLAYAAAVGEGMQIFVAPAEGGQPGRQLTDSRELNTDPVWSPKGDFIAYVSAERDIFLVRPDGGGLKQLTDGPGQSRSPFFSPDGQKLVFSNDRDGQWRLYIMNIDGGDQKIFLPGFPAAQRLPFWSAQAPAMKQ